MNYAGALNSALQAISSESRWCVWKMTAEGKKEPLNPKTGGGAMSNQPSTWADFNTAYEAREKLNGNGVGFFLGGGYAGIDIDDCIDDSGKISDMAGRIIERMDTYTERSPRKHGVHMLFRVPEDFTLEGKQGVRNDALGLELYVGKRYLTVTGDVYGTEKPIENREKELLEIYREYFIVPRENKAKKQAENAPQRENILSVTGDESDSELWDKMFSSQNGAKIRALYNGDISGYNDDPSRADLALCCYLAYWTGHDASRIDRMFRQSRLIRPKWDEPRGEYPYGVNTIAKAMNDTPRYTPPTPQQGMHSVSSWKYQGGGFDESKAPKLEDFFTEDDEFGYVEGVQDETPSQPANDSARDTVSTSEDDIPTVLDYLKNSFMGDLERVKPYRHRKTGYSNIDKYNGLFPGLYVIGSLTGNGKTTFCGQMADYLARAGESVLYFSLEQTRLELVTKALSRLTAQEWLNKYGADALIKYDHTDAISANAIWAGNITKAVQRAIETYKTFTERLRIIECGFDTNINAIRDTVEQFMTTHKGVKPVVFVDYLQLVRNPNPRLSTKDAVDDNVRAFKKLSAENGLVVIVISSINRQNYLSVVDFESFKESGSIEYTSDVVWGLQLLCMNAPIFNSSQDLQTKRRFVGKHKRQSPRKMELCGLKRRYNMSNTRYFFDYYAAYDLFVPYERPADDKRTDEEFADELDATMSADFEAFITYGVPSGATKSKKSDKSKRI